MLKINNLFKNYKNKQVLKGVNLHIKKGLIEGLIGVNGAGKSTLIECICGVKDFQSGDILINNINVKDKKRRYEIKKNIGYMPQRFSLFNDLTVEENLGYLCAVYNIDKSNIDRVISFCSLENYKNVVAKDLSGGYKQLLSMAGAIIHKPKLLILDEPTSAMDPIFRRMFWGVVQQCKNEGVTVLVITHYMEELVECDEFACLSNGKIAFNGELSEFKQNGMLNITEILNKYNFKD